MRTLCCAIVGVFLALWAQPASAQNALIWDFRVVRACAADVEALCSGSLPGGGRIKACMKANKDKLSATCLDTMLEAAAAGRETAETKPVPIPQSPADMTYNGLRGVIYCEIWLFRLLPGEAVAGVYDNTSALNNAADPMNTCPANLWDKVAVPSLEAQFDILAARLKPPSGWKYRVAVLDKDLTISTPQGYNWIVQDVLQNTYDACKEGACTFQP